MSQLSSILLVDDDATTNFLNRLLVQRAGITDQILVAEDGREALRILHDTCPGTNCSALVLLDLNMPVFNGLEFLQAYQQLPPAQRQSTLVIVLTSAVLDRDLAQLQRLPVAGVLAKPLTKEKLQRLLDQYFPA